MCYPKNPPLQRILVLFIQVMILEAPEFCVVRQAALCLMTMVLTSDICVLKGSWRGAERLTNPSFGMVMWSEGSRWSKIESGWWLESPESMGSFQGWQHTKRFDTSQKFTLNQTNHPTIPSVHHPCPSARICWWIPTSNMGYGWIWGVVIPPSFIPIN